MRKIIIIFIFFISNNLHALNLDIGFTTGKTNSSNKNQANGFNLNLLFGNQGQQFGIGTKKVLQKQNNNKYNSLESLSVFYRSNYYSFGVFYGGSIPDVENFIKSFKFSEITYQHGASIELIIPLGNSFLLGLEGRHHVWHKDSAGDDFQSYWLNLNYKFSL